MNYSLDTNVCIQYLNGKDPGIAEHLSACKQGDVFICSVVRYELLVGAHASTHTQTLARRNHFLSAFPSYAFDDAAASLCSELRVQLEAKGQMIGAYDVQIAAIALLHNLTLVTHNTREFSRVARLKLVDWQSKRAR